MVHICIANLSIIYQFVEHVFDFHFYCQTIFYRTHELKLIT